MKKEYDTKKLLQITLVDWKNPDGMSYWIIRFREIFCQDFFSLSRVEIKSKIIIGEILKEDVSPISLCIDITILVKSKKFGFLFD